MPQVITRDVQSLRAEVAGQVLAPHESGYDEARTVWNGGIDRRPAVILRPVRAQDVSAAIAFAREHDLEISVRGGAHAASGIAAVDDGLMIDLSGMRESPSTRWPQARVGGGATIADLDTATQEHGLAVPRRDVGHTGVGGLTLGGGMGWLTRSLRPGLRQPRRGEIVVADGAACARRADENPDLLWALRGGGGNFGVVTEFEFRLHPIGPMVHFGLLFWELERGAEALRPTGTCSGPLPGHEHDRGRHQRATRAVRPSGAPLQPGYALALMGPAPRRSTRRGRGGSGRDGAPVRVRHADAVRPAPADVRRGYRAGLLAYDKCVYVADFTDDVIAVVT